MSNKWSKPPIVEAVFRIQQLRARLERLALQQKFENAEKLLQAEQRRIKAQQ